MTKEKNEIKIGKIEIIVKDKKLELSIADAKELRDILNKTFEEKGVQYIPYTPYIPYPVYVDRILPAPMITPYWERWTTICGGIGDYTNGGYVGDPPGSCSSLGGGKTNFSSLTLTLNS